MLNRTVLLFVFVMLAYGFWLSPDFKQISAGVAIFLFGMLFLEEGFRAFTGGLLERLLRHTTASRWRSLSFGIVTTTLMQSSSLVSVIAISFLSAGLISLAAGIGIIFGANLGTTTGAWLVAGLGLKVKVSAYAMPMLVFGIILVFQRSKTFKGIGYILAGLGFLFLGIHYMKEGFESFRDHIDIAQYAVGGYPGLFLFTAIGIFATVVMQSSHATLVLIITALASQQVSYENALALAIGANIGTTITAILGAMSANHSGKQLAGAHLIFNLVTGLVAILLIHQLTQMVDWLAFHLNITQDDYTLKLALFHTLFNLLGILLMLPFTDALVRLLERTIPEREAEIDQPKYLTPSAAEFANTALEAVRQETSRVYEKALRLIIDTIGLRRSEILSEEALNQAISTQTRIHRMDVDAMYARHIKGLHAAILAFISTSSYSREGEELHTAQLSRLREANQSLVEAVKDTKHLQKNLLRYLNADHAKMRDIYNGIRVQLAQLIRELYAIQQSGEGAVEMLSLDSLKLIANENREKLNQQMSRLISELSITPAMGSSVMNDSVYAHNISLNLIQATQTLFAIREAELAEAAQNILLDKSDLNEITQQSSTTEATTPQ